MIGIRKRFIEKLLLELLKNREEVEVGTIMPFCEDALRHLENDIEDDYETNQHFVRMKDLFQGYVVVDWKEADFEYKKHKKLNKTLVQHCVMFYNECWKNRNEVMHDEQKQMEHDDVRNIVHCFTH